MAVVRVFVLRVDRATKRNLKLTIEKFWDDDQAVFAMKCILETSVQENFSIFYKYTVGSFESVPRSSSLPS